MVTCVKPWDANCQISVGHHLFATDTRLSIVFLAASWITSRHSKKCKVSVSRHGACQWLLHLCPVILWMVRTYSQIFQLHSLTVCCCLPCCVTVSDIQATGNADSVRVTFLGQVVGEADGLSAVSRWRSFLWEPRLSCPLKLFQIRWRSSQNLSTPRVATE